MTQSESTDLVTAADLALFCRQLGTLLSAGVPLQRALEVATEQCSSPRLKAVAGRIRADVEAGLLVSEALAEHPDLFSPFYLSLVAQGEQEGVLDGVMTTLADYLDRERLGPRPVVIAAAGGVDVAEGFERLKPLIYWEMTALGITVLGIAAIWWSCLSGLLPPEGLGVWISLWIGVAILTGASLLRSFQPARVVYCSFCGRSQSAIEGSLSQGPGVAICPDCLRSRVRQMRREREGAAKADEPRTADADPESREAEPYASPSPGDEMDADAFEEEEPPEEGEGKRIEI